LAGAFPPFCPRQLIKDMNVMDKKEYKQLINPIIADVNRLRPSGTNSIMFTECCGCAICSDQRKCPRCGRFVIGYDAESSHERSVIRWKSATAHWPKRRRL